MKRTKFLQSAFIAAIGIAATALGETAATNRVAEQQSAETLSVQQNVDRQTLYAAQAKRGKIVQDAVGALQATRDALRALDEEKPEEALKDLETAIGKLALAVARNPGLAYAPVEVSIISYDLYAHPETVRLQARTAQKLLEEGRVQAARAILSSLASEIRIRTLAVPLATYPDALKAVVPLIDSGLYDVARTALQTILNTLVVTEEVIPLPIVRAQALLAAADPLTEQKNRSAEQEAHLEALLKAARNQIELAEALGYGTPSLYRALYEELDRIEKKVRGGESGIGFLDELKLKLRELRKSVKTEAEKEEKEARAVFRLQHEKTPAGDEKGVKK